MIGASDVVTPQEIGRAMASDWLVSATKGCTPTQMAFQLATLREAAIMLIGTEYFNRIHQDKLSEDEKAKFLHRVVQDVLDYHSEMTKNTDQIHFEAAIEPGEQQ